MEPYDDFIYEPVKIIDAGGNRVAVILHQRGKPHDGDAWVEMDYGLVYTVEEGLIARADFYATPEGALEPPGYLSSRFGRKAAIRFAWKATLLALGSRGRAEDRRAGSGGRTAPRCAGWWRIRTIETPEVTHLSYRIATTDRSAA